MLVHNITDLINSAPGTTRLVEIDEQEPDLGPDLVSLAPILGRARLHRTQRGVVVQCEVETELQLTCSRCLEPFAQPVSVRFDEEFRTPAEYSEVSESEDEPGFEIDEHHNVDLADPVRQYLTMDLPLAPLCRSDCPGLCPICGAPLAGHVCTAGDTATSASNPFAALADLLNERRPEP